MRIRARLPALSAAVADFALRTGTSVALIVLDETAQGGRGLHAQAQGSSENRDQLTIVAPGGASSLTRLLGNTMRRNLDPTHTTASGSLETNVLLSTHAEIAAHFQVAPRSPPRPARLFEGRPAGTANGLNHLSSPSAFLNGLIASAMTTPRSQHDPASGFPQSRDRDSPDA